MNADGCWYCGEEILWLTGGYGMCRKRRESETESGLRGLAWDDYAIDEESSEFGGCFPAPNERAC